MLKANPSYGPLCHRLDRVKAIFLKGMLGIYVIAFTSLYSQVRALFGDEGIVPISDFLKKSTPNLQAFNIVQLSPKLGVDHGTFLEFVCMVSALTSIFGLFSKRFENALTYGFLWYVYFSIHQIGQGFVSFRGDLLILEVGFIAIFLAPLLPRSKTTRSDHDHLFWFLLKWVVFRWFVSSVVSLYLDDESGVYNPTFIQTAAQSVPIPSLVNWYIYNLSARYLAFIQPFQHTLKLLTPFLIIFDLKYTRLLAFYTLLYLSIFQTIFDNEGFVDLTIALCLVSILKDRYYYKDPTLRQSRLKTVVDVLFLFGFIALVSQAIIKGFGANYTNSSVNFKIKFTSTQFKKQTAHFLAIGILLGLYDLSWATYQTFSSKRTPFIKNLIYTIVAIALFAATIPTLTRYDQNLENRLQPLRLKEFSRLTAPFKFANNYAVPLKLSQHYSDGRPELVIESKESSSEKSWDVFNLQYKPSFTSKTLPLVVPHLPRLDVKMWYAARQDIANNQWLNTLAYRLMTRNKNVLKLMANNNYITKSTLIKIALYKYKFSQSSAQSFDGYWSKPSYVKDYIQPITSDELKKTMKENALSIVPSRSSQFKADSIEKMLVDYLDISSDYIQRVDQTHIIWAFLSVIFFSLLRNTFI